QGIASEQGDIAGWIALRHSTRRQSRPSRSVPIVSWTVSQLTLLGRRAADLFNQGPPAMAAGA
ncbi:MAG: hypothetical protein J2P48_04130, partial [Alphaproteobacteria bacterium]|nr:hypothetical protein [Alphaproteobacteria bacterium]